MKHTIDKKIINLMTENTKYCSCGHSVVVFPTTEYKVCTHCNKLVYYDREKQREYEKKLKKEDFRVKFWKKFH